MNNKNILGRYNFGQLQIFLGLNTLTAMSWDGLDYRKTMGINKPYC